VFLEHSWIGTVGQSGDLLGAKPMQQLIQYQDLMSVIDTPTGSQGGPVALYDFDSGQDCYYSRTRVEAVINSQGFSLKYLSVQNVSKYGKL
jgi:hypothetical protein